MVSLLLAERAVRQAPEKTRVFRCGSCGFAGSERGLAPERAERLYVGYRGEECFRQRNRFQPWHGRRKSESIGSEAAMEARRQAMAGTMGRARAAIGGRGVGVGADWGGGKGQMLKDLPDAENWVYEFSGAEPPPWARPMARLADLEGRCDLAMACQVLEHGEGPLETSIQASALARKGGWGQSMGGAAWRGGWLDAVARRPWLRKGLAFVSAASRLAIGWIRPFRFWSMREPLKFFTPQALRSIGEQAGLDVALVESNAPGLAWVGVKR